MWEQIRANHRRSVMLIAGLAVILALMGFSIGFIFAGPEGGVIGVLVAVVVWLVQLLLAYAGGEKLLISGLGARQLTKEDSPRLFNVVEEMVIASGLGYVPRILLIDDPAPNAFAIGTKPESSAVAVTSGLMYRLTRDELQGVIAHEIAHLKNRDVEFMTVAGVMLGTIIILSEVLWRSLRYGGRVGGRGSSRGNAAQAQAVMLVVALVVAILGPFMAQILYFATSRKREYLADACAAQFTRYPDGLASALLKIERAAGAMSVSRALAPMFIINPRLSATDADPADNLFSTHPATHKRVKVLRAMAGAGLAAYEEAYRATLHKGLLGTRSLAEAERVELRPPSDEGPLESRQDTAATTQRLHGFIPVKCECGMEMRVPPLFEDDEMVCIRCGRKNPLPSASDRYKAHFGLGKSPDDAAQADDAPTDYQRKGTGWESFRCSCGATVQIGPTFQAPRARCAKCRRMINILPFGV